MNAESPPGFSVHARVRARRSAVQACYQWCMNSQPIQDVINEFVAERSELKKADAEYFRELLRGVAAHVDEINAELSELLDRPVEQLDPVERAILYIGIFELKYRTEIPWRVVVNESVELARMFGAEQSHRYINGVLDRAARRIRTLEDTGTG